MNPLLVRDLDAAWASWDVERIISHFTDDCLYEDLAVGAAKRGKKEVSNSLREFSIGFPDVRVEFSGHCFSNDRLCFEWIMTGTHSEDRPGRPATGKRISTRGVSVAEFTGGKIARQSDYYDMVTFLRQLDKPLPSRRRGTDSRRTTAASLTGLPRGEPPLAERSSPALRPDGRSGLPGRRDRAAGIAARTRAHW
jgi:steroid delta-isomerase-like uncharacterized protein